MKFLNRTSVTTDAFWNNLAFMFLLFGAASWLTEFGQVTTGWLLAIGTAFAVMGSLRLMYDARATENIGVTLLLWTAITVTLCLAAAIHLGTLIGVVSFVPLALAIVYNRILRRNN